MDCLGFDLSIEPSCCHTEWYVGVASKFNYVPHVPLPTCDFELGTGAPLSVPPSGEWKWSLAPYSRGREGILQKDVSQVFKNKSYSEGHKEFLSQGILL